jgi:hypothetical protein
VCHPQGLGSTKSARVARGMSTVPLRGAAVFQFHEPAELRQVLECVSALALSDTAGPIKSATALAHSKTLAHGTLPPHLGNELPAYNLVFAHVSRVDIHA